MNKFTTFKIGGPSYVFIKYKEIKRGASFFLFFIHDFCNFLRGLLKGIIGTSVNNFM